MTIFDIFTTERKIKNTRKKKAKNISSYKEEKVFVHKTINGIGIVGRLFKKNIIKRRK